MPNYDYEYDEQVASESQEKLAPPSLYNVVIHNDDFTTMEFVMLVLQQIFQHAEADAFRIMWQVHTQGAGIAGTYTREIADTKAEKAMEMAQGYEYPLLFTVEQA